ncbi:uncharacterized protein LOC115362654 [Myripristis murdjan]|uniref:uncharacterized protein LOC115362654 n=1 Tax=Myripristis murdjan TaxID=586833 RepID=UPI0011762B98|nr:uncharacterized protein LOC115362654 [Myripristis murdjan]
MDFVFYPPSDDDFFGQDHEEAQRQLHSSNRFLKHRLNAPGCLRPLQPKSSNSNRFIQHRLMAPGCQRPLQPKSSNSNRLIQHRLMAPGCQRPLQPKSSSSNSFIQHRLMAPGCQRPLQTHSSISFLQPRLPAPGCQRLPQHYSNNRFFQPRRLARGCHLLLIISPPSSPPASGLATLTTVFSDLGVPLSAEKTEGPSTSMEFLGITLDTNLIQASLPVEKLNRISLLISNFLLAPHCTKRQLLSLLGHLNFAIRIIPQGKAFISHLLSIATSVPSLLDFISLDSSCRAELRLWLNLLSNWNGITFFYDDHMTHSHDINLFTDAAPSAGFGGFYDPSSAILWGHEWSRKSILLYSDNQAVVDIINKGRSNSPSIMPFMRRLTWHSVTYQYILRAAHVPGHFNAIADSLSRFSFQKFRSLVPHADNYPTPVPPYSALIFNL